MNLTLPIREFQLFLFSTDAATARKAINAGVDAIIVDWENQGKKLRQENFDTQINYDTYEDLCRMRDAVPPGQLICRINGFTEAHTPMEVELAIQAGADEIFLPMVCHVEEVLQTCYLIAGRAKLNILVETISSLECLEDLAKLKLNRAYVGLNDLHIQQNSRNIFVPLMDGTIENIRRHFDIQLGAGGVTFPPHGRPIASKYLINEYARLGIDFSFLRRTFLKDHLTLDMDYMVHHIKTAYYNALLRTPEQIELDLSHFREQVGSWTANPYYI